MAGTKLSLLAILELGGYPNFTSLYRDLGFEVEFVTSQRRAQTRLKKSVPDVMATLQRHPGTKVIVFYQPEHADKFERLNSRFPIFAALPFPVDAEELERQLRRAQGPVPL